MTSRTPSIRQVGTMLPDRELSCCRASRFNVQARSAKLEVTYCSHNRSSPSGSRSRTLHTKPVSKSGIVHWSQRSKATAPPDMQELQDVIRPISVWLMHIYIVPRTQTLSGYRPPVH